MSIYTKYLLYNPQSYILVLIFQAIKFHFLEGYKIVYTVLKIVINSFYIFLTIKVAFEHHLNNLNKH